MYVCVCVVCVCVCVMYVFGCVCLFVFWHLEGEDLMCDDHAPSFFFHGRKKTASVLRLGLLLVRFLPNL